MHAIAYHQHGRGDDVHLAATSAGAEHWRRQKPQGYYCPYPPRHTHLFSNHHFFFFSLAPPPSPSPNFKKCHTHVPLVIPVLSDVISTMFGDKFIQELFKPQVCYSGTSTRQIFDRLAHSSIMRLNESSMSKLYDLMTMGLHFFSLSRVRNLIFFLRLRCRLCVVL